MQDVRLLYEGLCEVRAVPVLFQASVCCYCTFHSYCRQFCLSLPICCGIEAKAVMICCGVVAKNESGWPTL